MKTQAKRFSSFLLILLSLLICCAATSGQPATQPTSQPSTAQASKPATAPTPEQLEQARNVFRQRAPLTDADKARIEKLITQLGSKHWKDRDNATKALKTEPFAALAMLRQAIAGKDQEVAQRAQGIIHDLESQYSDVTWPLRLAISTRQAAKDAAVVPDLLAILLMYDDDLAVRNTAWSGLSRLTGQDFGYRSGDQPDQRRQAAKMAQQWWDKNKPTFVPKPPADPAEIALELGGGVELRLILIPAGKFTMGGAKEDRWDRIPPPHEVTITKPFYIGVYTVTQEQYEQLIGKNPGTFKAPHNPVECVSWKDAAAFCEKLAKKTAKKVHLPTEAQWEYACRAGTTTRFSFGNNQADLPDYAWCNVNSEDKTHPIGQKKPNPWGLYDMHGNVWQWCSDYASDLPADAKSEDPQGPLSGSAHVLRGGNWCGDIHYCLSASPWSNAPDYFEAVIGFRVVVDLK